MAAHPTPEAESAFKGNVLLVANYPPAVGYAWWLMEHFWTLIADHCALQGRRCYLAYPRDGAIPATISESVIETFICDLRPRDPHSLNLARQLRDRSITAVYFVDQPYFSLSYLAFRRAGVGLIINHDHTPGDRPAVTGLRRTLKAVRNCIRGATCDVWLAVSPLMRERALRNGLVAPERVFVVQNGIPPSPTDADARFMARRGLGIAAEKVAVAIVGRAHPYKRIDFAIRVADHVCNVLGRKDIVFMYFGDGPARDDLERDAAGRNVSRSFIFAGNRHDVRALLPGFDLALHPSMGEGFSLAILEYMDAGLVTIVPDIPSVRQAIEHGRTGFVFPDADVQAAAELINRLAGDEGLRWRIGTQAASTVANQYSLQRTDQEFRSVLYRVLKCTSIADA